MMKAPAFLVRESRGNLSISGVDTDLLFSKPAEIIFCWICIGVSVAFISSICLCVRAFFNNEFYFFVENIVSKPIHFTWDNHVRG